MKHSVSIALIAFFLLAMTCNVRAQEINGHIENEAGQGVPYATIELLTMSDSTVIVGGVSDEKGLFSLDAQGYQLPLLLRTRVLGYRTSVSHVKSFEALIVILAEEATMLEEMVVTAQRISHKMIPGGLSTDISLSPLANLADIYSVLRGVPLVEVKGEEITVVGHGTPIIYINDKLMRDKTQLQQLRPYLIERIEVLTTPDSRYSASATSVIKIYTKREPGSGLSGSVGTSLKKSIDAALGYGGHIKLNYRYDGWDFYYNTSYYDLNNSNHNPYVKSHSKVDEDEWTAYDELKYFFGGKEYNNVFGINYEDKVRSLGLRYSLLGENDYSSSHNVSELRMNQEPLLKYSSDSREDTKWNVAHRPSAYYLRHFGAWKAQLDADFYFNKNRSTQNIIERIVGNPNVLNAENMTSKETHSAGVRGELSGDLGKGSLTVGGEYTWVKNNYVALNAEELELPDTRTKTAEQMAALFAQYALPIGAWQASAGLRMEYVDTDFNQNGKRVDEVSRRSFNLFPSFSFSGELGRGWNGQIAMRSIISRPSYWLLQPTYRYISKWMYKSGNPQLKPLITYRVQSMVMKSWFMAMLSYDYNKDNILDEHTNLMPDESSPTGHKPKTILLAPINGKPYHSVRLTLNAAPKIGCWSPDLSFIVNQEIGFEYWDFETFRNRSKPVLMINFNNSFALPHDIYLFLSADYAICGHQKNMQIDKPLLYTYGELSKKWWYGKLYTSLSVYNLTNSHGGSVWTYSRYSRQNVSMFSPTAIKLNITYRFNNAKSKYRGQGALNSVLDRMN